MASHPNGDRQNFTWHEFDANAFLPQGWAEQIMSFALEASEPIVLVADSVTSRESSRDITIPILTASGVKIKERLRWVFDLYRWAFRDLGQTCVHEPLSVGVDERHAIVINAQRGTDMRYECHVDSNPLSGLLFVTSHPDGEGGELVVANQSTAVGMAEISRDCQIINPASGKLIFFDARENPHFVRPLKDPLGVRVVVVMNFYTPSCAESTRPKDLTSHMFGEDSRVALAPGATSPAARVPVEETPAGLPRSARERMEIEGAKRHPAKSSPNVQNNGELSSPVIIRPAQELLKR
jgi:hypothetical protein